MQLNYKSIIPFVEEVRMVVGAPITVSFRGEKLLFDVTRKEDVNFVLSAVTRASMYAMNDTLVKGYLTFSGGIRIGVCGEAVIDGDTIKTIKHVNGIVIRVPHEKHGLTDGIVEEILIGNRIRNTLLIGAPLSGKTTYLREFSRVLSTKYLKNVVIIDEKDEISATSEGISALDVGYSSVLVGMDRTRGIECAIRNLSPEVIITDELYGELDREAIKRCIKSGVGVIASMHGENFSEFSSLFDYVIKLSTNPIGKILEAHTND